MHLYICIYIYAYVDVDVDVYTYIYIYMYIYIRIYIYVYICMYIYICICICIYTCVNTRLFGRHSRLICRNAKLLCRNTRLMCAYRNYRALLRSFWITIVKHPKYRDVLYFTFLMRKKGSIQPFIGYMHIYIYEYLYAFVLGSIYIYIYECLYVFVLQGCIEPLLKHHCETSHTKCYGSSCCMCFLRTCRVCNALHHTATHTRPSRGARSPHLTALRCNTL